MISITLSGGIGNQLFMYAAARAFALRNGTDLAINIKYGFANDREYQRNYELHCFNVAFKKRALQTFDYPGGHFVRFISRKLGFNLLYPIQKYLVDPTNNRELFSDFIKIRNKHLYIEGYWQSSDYFHEYENQIRQDLTFSFEKSKELIEEEKKIFGQRNTTPVSIGFRLYQDCKHKMSFEVTQADYYIRAMNYICERVENPVFYVFTQAKDWVKENIESIGKYKMIYITEKSQNGTIEDLYLMTRFKFHIISNSSYYWWGAWLAKGKLVVTNDNFINKQSNCKGWIVL